MRPWHLLAAIIALSCGIAARTSIPIDRFGIATVLLAGTALMAAWHIVRRSSFGIAGVALLAFALGCARTAILPAQVPLSLVGKPATLQGVIIADPDVREDSQRVTIALREGREATKLLAVAPRYPSLAYGQRVTVAGTPSLPEAFDADGGRTFDYPHFLAKDGIVLMVKRAQVTVLEEPKDPFVRARRALYDAKHAFAHGLERALPEPKSTLAAGLITGGKQGLGDRLLDAFTRSGLLPIVVLSGYNVMIIAEAVLAALRFLPKRAALLVAGALIALFVLAAGTGASALRAGIMAGLALLARATGRTYDALRALIAVFALMILLNPLSLVYDPGFQFSFAATLGLILLAGPFGTRLARVPSATLREVLASTLAAQLFVLPLLLYQTGNLSLVSVPANLLALPLVPLAMLLSCVAGVAGLLAPAVAPIAGLPAYLALSYLVMVGERAAALPLASVTVPRFPFALVILAYALIAWLVVSLNQSAPAPEGAGARATGVRP